MLNRLDRYTFNSLKVANVGVYCDHVKMYRSDMA